MPFVSPSITNSSAFETCSSNESYLPLTIFIEVIKYLKFGKPKYKVKNNALKTNKIITKGAPLKTSKNTILDMKSEKGLNASSIF